MSASDRTLVDSVPAALAVVRAPGLEVLCANARFTRLLPHAAEGHVLGDALLAGERVGAAFASSASSLADVPVRADEARWVDLSWEPVRDDPGAYLVAAQDVTARAAHRHERAKLDAVFGQVVAALALLRGPDAVYERTNENYDALFTDRPLLRKPLLEALPELRGQKFPDLISAAFRGEPYREVEARALLRRTTQGELEERFFDQSYTQVLDADGKPYGVLVQAIDVTDRVRTRERLAVETDRSARLLRETPTPFFSVSGAWILTSVNPAAEEALGLRSADVIGKSLFEIFPGLVGSSFLQSYIDAMKHRRRVVTEDYYPDFDRWYEAYAYPFDDGFAVSFYDITRRKRDELAQRAEREKFEAMFRGSAAAMVFLCGPELRYDLVNAKYAQLVPGRELVGRALLEALPELEGSRFPPLLREVFDTGVPASTHEELAPLRNPETGVVEQRYFDTGISRVNDGEGKPYGVFVQSTEVTDRVEVRKRMEEALRTRETFLSIASHELRTPLTAAKLQVQLLRRSLVEGVDLAWTKKLTEQLDRSLGRLARLVDDMLDISRIQSGRLRLEREHVELAELARAVVERFGHELSNAGITVTVNAPAQPVVAHVDRFRIEQVVTNLLTNAMRYAARAPLSIHVAEAGDFAELVVQDGGPGIAEADRERIFERFERLATPSQGGGLGLGLFIVREIVDAHGGSVHAGGAAGQGATFTVRLPRG